MDNLCFLNIIGGCPNTTTTRQILKKQLSSINEFINERTMSTFMKSATTAGNFQQIIAEAEGDVIITDIDMKQYAELTSDTKFDVNSVINDETNINEMIDMLADISLSVKAKMEGGILDPGQITRTESEDEIITEVKNQFKSLIKEQDVLSCVESVLNEQTITAKAKGDVIIKGIRMDQTAVATTECLMKNVSEVFSKMDLEEFIKERVRIEDDVDVETIGGLTSFFNNLFKGIVKFKYIIFGVIALIVGSVTAIIVIGMFRKRKRKKIEEQKKKEEEEKKKKEEEEKKKEEEEEERRRMEDERRMEEEERRREDKEERRREDIGIDTERSRRELEELKRKMLKEEIKKEIMEEKKSKRRRKRRTTRVKKTKKNRK
jgi:hypothetical protein